MGMISDTCAIPMPIKLTGQIYFRFQENKYILNFQKKKYFTFPENNWTYQDQNKAEVQITIKW